ncbi:glycoside hydrolase family 27 protein [Pseudonocardia endophytica]|nr:glycoside hydrolase family 27 protein [Pseudonocardia endophytica]
MGWNSWNTFGCAIDENRILAAAGALVTSGMRDAGYRYVVVDDCWQAPARAADGALQADPVRFPHGMAWLGDRIHAMGLRFGIYQSPEEQTCAEYGGTLLGATGALGHEDQDARTFADWGVDYLKYDWCSPHGTIDDQVTAFATMDRALRATGRDIVYSINPNSAHFNSGPYYDWGRVADLWRTTEDVADAWSTGCVSDCAMGVTEILDAQAPLAGRAGPGRWNDPDMLEVGVRGTFTPDENRAHMTMWAMMAAPLMAGNDVTAMPADVRDVLTAPGAVAVDQDPLGRQATRLRTDGRAEVWARPLADGSVAVALLNRGDAPTSIATSASEAGLPASAAYRVSDVWAGTSATTASPDLAATVPAHGVAFYRVTPTG